MDETKKESLIVLRSREEISIDGVIDILSFDENELAVETTLGRLYLDGEGLHVTLLSVEEGKLGLKGKINALNYATDKEKKGGRLFGRKS